MKYKLFFTLLCFASIFVGHSQTKKLDSQIIWDALYPTNTNFNNDSMLIRKVKRDGSDLVLRTAIKKIFYYKIGIQEKASVIFLRPLV